MQVVKCNTSWFGRFGIREGYSWYSNYHSGDITTYDMIFECYTVSSDQALRLKKELHTLGSGASKSINLLINKEDVRYELNIEGSYDEIFDSPDNIKSIYFVEYPVAYPELRKDDWPKTVIECEYHTGEKYEEEWHMNR